MFPTQPIPLPMGITGLDAAREAAEIFKNKIFLRSIQKVKTTPMQVQQRKQQMQKVLRQALQLQVYIYCHTSQIKMF